jgi:PGF-CTERM protein
MRKRILTLAVVFALVATGAAMVGTAAATHATATSTTTQDEGAQVTFDDQRSGGTTVTVASVTVPEGGFVTIHDASLGEGETLASVRGSSAYLSPGNHDNVTITLDQPVSEDTTLVAMPHKDTDADRTYDFVSSNAQDDGPYRDDDGIVTDGGEVTATATVEVSAQNSSGQYVIVDRVELANGGFVTAHDSSLLDGATFDSVRGTSGYLSAGVHEDVRIELDEPLEEDDTIIAMAHKDTNDNQQYDFVDSEGEEDGPYPGDVAGTASDPAGVTVSDEASVTFEAQTSGGGLVVVDSAFLPDGGFVTAHDSSLLDGETFASVRGTSDYLEPGVQPDVHVTLDEPLEEDDTIIAMAHKDTNDNQQYDFVDSEGEEDGPYPGDVAGTASDPGNVTVSAQVSIGDQTSDGNTLKVHHVDLSEGGFVTVHDASLGGGATFESVRGTSEYLEPGFHADVEVALDEPLKTSTTVFAMPHLDTNGNEAYDFVSSDGAEDAPYTTTDGDIVLDAGSVDVEMSGNDEGTGEDDSTPTGEDDSTPTDGNGPGFGPVAALVALVAAALLARRR